MDKYQIAANVALEGMEGYQGRLTAKMQRRLFGKKIFGRKMVYIDAAGQGRVEWWRSACFGTDSIGGELTFGEIAERANNPDHPEQSPFFLEE
jgi:hypothetical protein